MTTSIFSPCHNTKYLRELYDTIKDQDFTEWILVPNGEALKDDFSWLENDKRVKIIPFTKETKSIGERVQVWDAYAAKRGLAKGQGNKFWVEVGDRVKNVGVREIGQPMPGQKGRGAATVGTIEEITPDGLILVNTGVGKQEWDPDTDLIEIDAKEREKTLSKQKSKEDIEKQIEQLKQMRG